MVWQRLEAENQEFFKAYYLRLLVKEQIMKFNRLLSEQVELMRLGLTGISPVLATNGPRISPNTEPLTAEVMQQPHLICNCGMPIQSCSRGIVDVLSGAPQNTIPLKADDMQPNVCHNCGSPIQSCAQETVNISGHDANFDVSPNVFYSQNPSMALAQTMNGNIVNTKAGYTGNSPFNFNPLTNFKESCPPIGDASVTSFSSVESNEQHLSDDSLHDLLNSFFGSPYRGTDANNFLDSHGDMEKLNSASESWSYQRFGGN